MTIASVKPNRRVNLGVGGSAAVTSKSKPVGSPYTATGIEE